MNVCLFLLERGVVGFDGKCLTSKRDAGSWNQHDVMMVLRGGCGRASPVDLHVAQQIPNRCQDEAHATAP